MAKNFKNNDSSKDTTMDEKKDFKSTKNKGKSRNRRSGNYGNRGEYKKTPATNDVSYRIANIKQRTDAGNISWSYQTGDIVPFTNTDPSITSSSYVLPGILARAEMTTPGTLFQGATPANVAANTLLTVMRSKTRVRNTYDAPDIEMILLALVDIYAGIAWAKRLYATVLMYSYMNKYLPDALFKIQHIDPTPLRTNQYAFVSTLNRIISKLNTIYVPDRMSYFQVVTQRYSNYFTEGASIKDQMYLAYPAVLKQFNTGSSTYYAGSLKPCFVTPYDGSTPILAKYGTKDATTDDLLYALDLMVDSLINDSDVPDITGDMMNAFGEGSRYLVPMLDAGTVAVPTFDEEFLEMFLNSKVTRPVYEWFQTFDATAESTNHTFLGWVIQDPTTNSIGMPSTYYNGSTQPTYAWTSTLETLLSVHHDPSVDKTIMITRTADRIVVDRIGNGSSIPYSWKVDVHAVAVLGLRFAVAFYDNNGNIQLNEFTSDASTTTSSSLLNRMRVWPFHYAPLFYLGDNTNGLVNIVGNLDIISTIDARDLNEINRLDLLNLLGAFETV